MHRPTIVLRDRNGKTLAESQPDATEVRAFFQSLISTRCNLVRADLDDLLEQAIQRQDTTSVTDEGRLNLQGLILDDVDLRDALGSKVDMTGASLRRAILRDAEFPGIILYRADLSGMIADTANLEGADLRYAIMHPVPQPKTNKARHKLRPKVDEFFPYDRTFLRGADLHNAKANHISMLCVDLSDAELSGISLKHSLIERCIFAGAHWDESASINGAVVLRSTLTSTTIHLLQTNTAVLRNNNYHSWPHPSYIVEAGLRAFAQIKNYAIEEIQQRRLMPIEMRIDHDRGLIIRGIVIAAVPIVATIAWKSVEGTSAISAVLALGIASAVVLRRYVTTALQSTVGALLERLNHAEAGYKSGGPTQAMKVFIAIGPTANKIADKKATTQTDQASAGTDSDGTDADDLA